MSESSITAADIQAICHRAAAANATGTVGYRPSTNQVLFFTLVWAVKPKRGCRIEGNCLFGQSVDFGGQACKIAQHLDEWGLVVNALKQGNEQEWELLRIQMNKEISYRTRQRDDMMAESLSDSLYKVFTMLRNIPDENVLEALDDPLQFIMNTQDTVKGIYDFGTPFYAYAKTIARNKLTTLFRNEQKEIGIIIPLDGNDLPGEDSAENLSEIEEYSQDLAACQEYRQRLSDLFDAIDSYLTPKPRQVILATLAARQQFWRALSETELPVPDYLPQRASLRSDADIAELLGITENNVRVHRSNAKKRISEVDPNLGRWLDRLLAR